MGSPDRPVASSMEPPTNPAVAAIRTVSAQDCGSSPNPFSRSADTGRLVASTMARAFASVSSRPMAAAPSGLPIEKAYPALVVASASNPSDASSFADPASHGFGTGNTPGRSCSLRKDSARALISKAPPQCVPAQDNAVRDDAAQAVGL